MENKDDNNLFDEIDDDEEEIKEEIVIDNNIEEENNNKNEKFINTYDKFLIDSMANENNNEYHYILKNQMLNIIDDIKKKQNEEQENKNNIKKQIFKDMANLFINNNNDGNDKHYNEEINIKDLNTNIKNNVYKDHYNNNENKFTFNQYTLNPNQLQNMNNKQEEEYKKENKNEYNNDNNNYMENIRDIDNTQTHGDDISENTNNKLNDNINEHNYNNEYLGRNEEKNKSIDINTKKNSRFLNNPNELTESKEYNINIDDFLKENTLNDEDMVNNATNIEYCDNNNNYNIKRNNENKNIKYTVKGNPELKQKINENYDYFSQKNKNAIPMEQKLTAKFNALATRETYYHNNNEENCENNQNFDKKSEMIYIDDCQTEEERKAKQKKFEERKQKKLKELEEKISHKRAQSKNKMTNINNYNYNNNNNMIDNITNKNNISNINDKQSQNSNINSNTNKNKPIILKPRSSKSKPMTHINNQKKNSHVTISALNKDDTQTINNSDYNYNNNNNNNNNNDNNKTKKQKPIRPMSTKSSNISRVNKITNNTTLMSNNASHYSTLSRVPIKIEREESKIANKKVKNVHYSKMSNKKVIKKAINEVCLAGNTNKEYRDKINDIIDKCEFENYIILFRGNYGRYDIKAIYTYDIQNKNIELLTCIGNAPNFIDSSMVATFYKYNISANQFKELRGTREFSCIVDGVCLRK